MTEKLTLHVACIYLRIEQVFILRESEGGDELYKYI